VLLPHGQNTVLISYRLVKGEGKLRLKLRPSLHFRPHDAPVHEDEPQPYAVTAENDRYEVTASSRVPSLRLFLDCAGPAFTLDSTRISDVLYRDEESRGYD